MMSVTATAEISKNLEEKSRLSEEARAKRNAYQRNWYSKNKDKRREYYNKYWERKAASGEG